MLRKRRSKGRRAPAPPTRSVSSPEQVRLLDEAESAGSTITITSAAGSIINIINSFSALVLRIKKKTVGFHSIHGFVFILARRRDFL